MVLDGNIDGVVGRVRQVFHHVFVGREPARFARQRSDLSDLTMVIGEFEVPGRQHDDHAPWMGVHGRFFVGAVVDIYDLHRFILESEFIVLGLGPDGVLRVCCVESEKNKQQGAK